MLLGPMCRCQFDTEVTDEASDAGTRWCCPGCREERTQFSCERCGIRQNVTTVASGLASSLFDEVEELFFECMELHRNRTEVACSMAFAAEQQRLTAKLSDILGSEIMQTLIASNWQIKAGVKSLLEGAINGRTNFTINFDGQMLDVGSMALYSILIDRLQAKITERNFEAVLERPNLAELYGRTEWTCPLCATSNGCNAEQCSTCRTNYFVIQLSRSPDVREVFREGLEYFFEGMDIITSTVLDETGRNSAIHILKAKTDVFLSSDAIQRLENLRWALRLPLAYLFAELFAAKRVLSFHVPNWSDINSCAIYASFVRQIIAKQKTDISIKPEYATITITPPSVRLDLIDEYESFESQKFSVTDNTKRFLLANKRILIDIAKKIYEGFDGADWVRVILKT